MLSKIREGKWAISQIGMGEGFWEVTRAELEGLQAEIVGTLINEDITEGE